MPATRRKLAAILAADVVSYSQLMSRNEEKTLRLLKSTETKILIPLIEKYYGRIFKKMGDGYLAEYPSIVDAVNSAVELQKTINARASEDLEQTHLRFRVGVNLGDVMVEDDDIYGEGVNLAGRLEAICEPNGVAITKRVSH